MKGFFIELFIFTGVFACHELAERPGFKRPDEIRNPNGDSELAIVMRNLHFEANKVKTALESGEEIELTLLKEYAVKVATATPTNDQMRDGIFYEYAASLENRVRDLSNTEHQKAVFNSFVNTCIACHHTTCPGPLKKIKKLQLWG